jgi:hypothetical protein
MTSMFKKLISVAPVGLGSVLAFAAAPSTASAHWVRLGLHIGLPPVVVEAPAPAPVYADCEMRIWVAPVYRTVCDRVWVPDQFENREVVFYHHGWRHVRHEQVLVAPGHYEDLNRLALVAPGHYETRIERVVVGN